MERRLAWENLLALRGWLERSIKRWSARPHCAAIFGVTSAIVGVPAPEQMLSANWPGEIKPTNNMEYVIVFTTAAMIALYARIIGRCLRNPYQAVETPGLEPSA